MKRLFLLAIIVSTAILVSAQEATNEKKERRVQLWGHVKSAYIKQGILGAKVTLMREDSTVVDSMTVFQEWHGDNKIDAAYRFLIPARPAKYIIRAEHPDYQPLCVDWQLTRIGRNEVFEATYHFLKPRMRTSSDVEGGMLEGVTVAKTRVKVFMRGDTIVYNADAFKLPDGSMLDDLIRQLPGAQLSADGQITVNGEKVDELTLNGKDFFGGKTKVMLENLPYYTVNQLKVYHKSTEKSEWLGREVEPKKHVMDVVLKREYATGFMGNADVSAGNHDLWMTRMFGMRYTDNSRLTFYANANNINESARPYFYGHDGAWTGGGGIGREYTHKSGVDLLVDDADKRWQENFNADVAWQKQVTDIQTSRESYLSSGSTFSRSVSNQTNRNFDVSMQNNFKTADSRNPWHTHANVGLTYSQRDNEGVGMDAQTNADPDAWGSAREMLDSVYAMGTESELRNILVNRSRTQSEGGNRTVSGKGDFGVWHRMASGDDGGINLRVNASHKHSHGFSQQRVDYFNTGGDDGDNRQASLWQNRYNETHPNHSYDFHVAPYYNVNLMHNWSLYTDYTYSQNFYSQDYRTYLLDRLAGYDANGNDIGTLPSTRDSLLMAIDGDNSKRQTGMKRTHALAAALKYSHDVAGKSKTWFRFYLTGRHFSDRLHYDSRNTDVSLAQHRVTVEPDVEFSYKRYAKADTLHDRGFKIHYNMSEELPSLLNQVDVRDNQNPLNVRLGNPNLKGTLTHKFGTTFDRTRSRGFHRWGLAFDMNLYSRRISQGYTYDAQTGVYTFQPRNVDGNWDARLSGDVMGYIGRKNRFFYNLASTLNYARNVDYVSLSGFGDSQLSHMNNWTGSVRAGFSWRGNDKFGLNGGASVSLRHATQSEGLVDDVNTTDYVYSLGGSYTLPLNVELTTKLTLNSTRGYSDSSFNRDELRWDLSLSRSVIKKRLVAILEFSDLLHQLDSRSAFVNGQGRTETVYNKLPSYVMFRLNYQFSKFPKKRNGSDRNMGGQVIELY